MPDLVCPAHTEEYSPSRLDLEGFQGWANRLRDIMTGLIDQPDLNFGMDIRWCHFYPYRLVISKGREFQVITDDVSLNGRRVSEYAEPLMD